MPMKLGTKMVEANTTATNARYIWFSCGDATGRAGNAALYYCVVLRDVLPWGRC